MPRFALWRFAILTSALCVALAAGCTNRLGPAPPPPPGGGGISPPIPMRDGGVTTVLDGAAGTSGTDAAIPCFIPLQQTGCATTFAAQVANDSACSRSVSGSQAGACGGYLVWSSGFSGILGSLTCVYDSTQNELVSGTICTDVSEYCNRDFCASGGSGIDVSSLCDVSALPLVCPPPDAGISIDAEGPEVPPADATPVDATSIDTTVDGAITASD